MEGIGYVYLQDVNWLAHFLDIPSDCVLTVDSLDYLMDVAGATLERVFFLQARRGN